VAQASFSCDFLLSQQRQTGSGFFNQKRSKNYPIEVKLGATPKKEWLKSFATLRVLKEEIGPDCVISLTNMVFPFDAKNYAIPRGLFSRKTLSLTILSFKVLNNQT